MQLVGRAISHMKFGEGIVKDLSNHYITILFSEGEKKFLYPKAFENHLRINDEQLQSEINQSLQLLQEEEVKKINQRSELINLNKCRSTKNTQKNKIYPDSQAVFGLVQNTREEVFQEWTVYAGAYQSGSSKGKHKLPVRLRYHSACLLTECREGETELNRRIIGIFMPREGFEGSTCKDGMIRSHKKYRIELKEKEQMPYRKYIPVDQRNEKWGKVELKYLSNVMMQKIIRDMIKMVEDKERKNVVEEIYEYFCLVNGLNVC